MTDKDSYIDKQIGGNYRIIAELNSGSFGGVFLGKHIIFEDEPIVAIKLLHAHLRSQEERTQFIQEAQVLKKLKHPHILRIIDAGMQEEMPYLVTEYAPGGSLQDHLQKLGGKPLLLDEAITILDQIGSALHYTHLQQPAIVHRDLKPENILFNAKGEAVLADFGIAAALATAKTKKMGFGGTPTYMAPEQFEGTVSTKSDQYALGCIAYLLVTGRKPFIVPSPSIEAMWYQHAKITPIAPRELNIQLPIYIEQAILKAMAKERTDRHPDILTFVAALQQPSKQWLNQGYAFNNLGRFEEALAAYQQASHLNPNDASAYNGKGYALNNLGRFEEALAAYQQASHLDPSFIYAYSNKGNTLNNLGRFKEALAAYQQALNIDPNFISALNGKRDTLNNIKRQNEALNDPGDGADNPLNDIDLHKDEIGLMPRGSRSAQPLDREVHNDAAQGARQQQPPFNQNKTQMEPLAPNPMRNNQPIVITHTSGRKSQSVLEPLWKLPDIRLLNNPEEIKLHMLGDNTTALAKIIQDTLRSFRVEAQVKPEDISIGPTVIRFGIRPTGKPKTKLDAQGRSVPLRDASGNIVYESRTRVSRIMALQNDLALVLEAKIIRMEAPVPGRPYVSVEIPNRNSRLVTLREMIESKEYLAAKAKLAIALGKDVAGTVRVGDLALMPHLIIAGATGSGKSVSINTIICSILMKATPDDVRLLMIDPKMVELVVYNGIPHLLAPVVTEVDKSVALLKVAINEMEKRYRLFSQLGVRNLDGYRKQRAERIARDDTSLKNLPAIVIIINELADLMMAAREEIEGMISRLAQLARAPGIHLVIATQRPSVDVITRLIKANIPTRISFMVSSAVDSRTIIDVGGAERLLGRGDMLYLPADAGKPERIQGAFVADDEIDNLVNYWKQQVQERTALMNRGKKEQDAAVMPPVVEQDQKISEYVSDAHIPQFD